MCHWWSIILLLSNSIKINQNQWWDNHNLKVTISEIMLFLNIDDIIHGIWSYKGNIISCWREISDKYNDCDNIDCKYFFFYNKTRMRNMGGWCDDYLRLHLYPGFYYTHISHILSNWLVHKVVHLVEMAKWNITSHDYKELC